MFRQASDLFPKIKRLIIGVINRGRQPIWIKPPFFGEQRPRVNNRLLLKIIAKRKIAKHFKESMMPRSVANIIKIIMLAACAHTFLARRSGHIWPFFKAREHIFEGNHPSIDKHQSRIILRHERRRSDTSVARVFKIIEEGSADIVGASHDSWLGEVSSWFKGADVDQRSTANAANSE